jgi:hypothetical protein
MGRIRGLRRLVVVVLGLVAAGTVAAAAAPSPVGLWRIKTFDDNNNLAWTGTQDICFLAGGTWFGPQFPTWSGFWIQKGDQVRLLGNWNDGAGNDSAELDFINVDLMTGPWKEWTDNYNTKYYFKAMLCSAGSCVGPPPSGTAPSSPPLSSTSSSGLSTATVVCSP